MNKEQAKNLKIGDKLININTYSVGKLTNIDNEFIHCYRIYEEEKDTSDLWITLNNWYTKDQLKNILVSPLQAVNLLQNDIFDIQDKFVCDDDYNLKEIVKDNTKSIYINTEGGIFLHYDDKCMKFVPYIKPFTKQDLKNGMKVKKLEVN